MSTSYKVAVIGTGNIARLHMAGYINHPQTDVVAVCDLDRVKAEKFASDHNVDAAMYDDYAEMVRKEKPDIVSVCLWPQLHLPVVRACASAGVPAVHCEKPMAPTWAQSLELAAVGESGATQLTFNHQRRFSPLYVYGKDLLTSGRYGKLVRMDAYSPAHVLDCGSHLVDFLFMYNAETPAQWVIGQVDARQVKKWFDVPFEFMAVGMIRFQNDVRAYFHSGDDQEHGWAVRLTCENGIIEVLGGDGGTVRHVQFDDGEGWQQRELDMDKDQRQSATMTGVVQDIITGLETGVEPELSWRKATATTEILFALYESSRSRARIDLPLQSDDNPFVSMLEAGVIGPSGE